MTLEAIVLASLYGLVAIVGGVLAWTVSKTHNHAVTLATLQTTISSHGDKHSNHESALENLRTTLEHTNSLLADFATKFELLFSGQLTLPGKRPARAAAAPKPKVTRKR